MQLVIKNKNADLNEQMRALIEEKVTRLTRFLDNITTATIEIRHEKTRNVTQSNVVQLTLSLGGHLLRAEERAADTRTALDAVVDVMQRQIIRYKEKLYARGRNQIAKDTTLRTAINNGVQPEATGVALADADEPRIVRTKQFTIKPMTAEEAAEQMELLGHDFFVFENEASHQYNVLYRRRDGNYGLIEPEMV